MRRSVTMADVAKAVGVHQTTVSRALRNHPGIPDSLRERVRAMAAKMHYRPNPLVSALISERKKGRRTGYGSKLALLTLGPSLQHWRSESPNFARLHDLIVQRADALGYGVEEFWLDEPGMTWERLRKILLHRGIRGLIIGPLPEGRQTLTLDFSDFAVVALRLTLKTPTLDHVSIDYFTTMQLAIEKLLASGHRRIAFATSELIDNRVNHLSLAAFLVEREFSPARFLKPAIEVRWTREKFLDWMRALRPDALISPVMAHSAEFRTWLQQDRWRLPGDLSLVTLDAYQDSRESGIVQNMGDEAEALVDRVTSRVERAQFGVSTFPQKILVSALWKDGDSLLDRTLSRKN